MLSTTRVEQLRSFCQANLLSYPSEVQRLVFLSSWPSSVWTRGIRTLEPLKASTWVTMCSCPRASPPTLLRSSAYSPLEEPHSPSTLMVSSTLCLAKPVCTCILTNPCLCLLCYRRSYHQKQDPDLETDEQLQAVSLPAQFVDRIFTDRLLYHTTCREQSQHKATCHRILRRFGSSQQDGFSNKSHRFEHSLDLPAEL